MPRHELHGATATLSRVYPPAPVPLTASSQLAGLEEGAFVAQPKWDGRRAVLLPDGRRYYKSGKPISQRPWSLLELPAVHVGLDLELMRDGYRVLDVMIPGEWDERQAEARRLGLELHAVEVRSVASLNSFLKSCLDSGLCDGAVMKRKASRYPWLGLGVEPLSGWLKYKATIDDPLRKERSVTKNFTEEHRRKLVHNQRDNGPMGREELEAAHGQLWTADELCRDYEVQGFLAPFVIVQRKSDSVIGTLTFQHSPRFYWGFEEDLE